MDSPDHNHYLQPAAAPTSGPAKGSIDRPGAVPNIIWQTRPAPPTLFENALGDAFERVFAAGVVSADGIVADLNAHGPSFPDGGAWTEARFFAMMRRLGEPHA